MRKISLLYLGITLISFFLLWGSAIPHGCKTELLGVLLVLGFLLLAGIFSVLKKLSFKNVVTLLFVGLIIYVVGSLLLNTFGGTLEGVNCSIGSIIQYIF